MCAPFLLTLAFLAQAPSTEGTQAAPPAASAPAEAAEERWLLDRIVAVVDGRPVLRSELELEARVALIEQGGVQAATAPLGEPDLAAALEWAIGQRLALAEAERLQVFEVAAEEVAQAVLDFAARFPDEAAYRAFLDRQEASDDQIASLFRRTLRVARYIESRVKIATRVGEDELRQFYDDHQADFGNQPFEKAREAIKALLTRESVKTVARSHLEQLRARADVRVVAPPDDGAAPDEVRPNDTAEGNP